MYRFSLQSLLNHQKILEDGLQAEFCSLQEEVAGEVAALEGLKATREKWRREKHRTEKEGRFICELIFSAECLKDLETRIELQKACIARAQTRCEEKREELVEVMKKRKTLERLKEKGARFHRQARFKQEQAFIDEMATIRFAPGVS